MTAADLAVTVDARWAGGRYGGYYPVRVRILNRGTARTLTVFVEPIRGERGALPRVTRTFVAEQNGTLDFTLPVPMIAGGTTAHFGISENGEVIRELSRQLMFPAAGNVALQSLSLLVISPVMVDTQPFAHAAEWMALQAARAAEMAPSRSGRATQMAYHYGAASYDEAEVIPPVLIPETWIAYSALDVVAVPIDMLASFAEAQRAALLQWVQTGGTLLVYGTGEPAGESPRVDRLIGFENFGSAGEWQKADPSKRPPLEWPPQEEQSYGRSVPPRREPGPPWPEDGAAFAKRKLLLGVVYAFPHNPFPGSVADWAWFTEDRGTTDASWTRRHGFSSRQGSDSFLDFLIPSVKSVPVFAFAGLITLFAVLIGPVNYIWLWRKRRLNMLVITVPLIALATSLGMFTYSAIAHGFGVKSRTRSLTVVDQQARSSVTIARSSLFSGVARPEGLQFTPNTAVYPIWPSDTSFDGGTVDWTNTQAFTTGWLPARTRIQFLTVSQQPERGRITFGDPNGNLLSASSGFDADIDVILAAGPDGRLYAGRELTAGGSTELHRATLDDVRAFAELLRKNPLEVPEDLLLEEDNQLYEYVLGSGAQINYSTTSMVEKKITRWLEGLLLASEEGNTRDDAGTTVLGTRAYLAVLKSDPRVASGVGQTRESVPYHLLYGYY